MAGRVTQSVVFAGTLQTGHTRVTQSILILGIGLGISCANPPNGMVGTAYSHAFPAGSGNPPYTFSITVGSLPPGLSLNGSTGVVSGTPTTQGTSTFTITVTDSFGATSSVSCSILIQTTNSATTTGSYGGAKKGCQPVAIRPYNPVDWSEIQDILEAVRPEPVEECRRRY